MTTPDRPQLGVVESADLALALALLGFDVVGAGANFRDAASQIRQHPAGDTMPVVIADVARPGLRAWVERQLGVGSRVVALRTPGVPAAIASSSVDLTLPASINAVMAAIGYGASPHPLGEEIVGADLRIAGLDPYRPAPPAAEVVEPTVEPAAEFEPASEPAPVIDPTPAPVEQPAPPAFEHQTFTPPTITADDTDDDDVELPEWARPVSVNDHLTWGAAAPAAPKDETPAPSSVPPLEPQAPAVQNPVQYPGAPAAAPSAYDVPAPPTGVEADLPAWAQPVPQETEQPAPVLEQPATPVIIEPELPDAPVLAATVEEPVYASEPADFDSLVAQDRAATEASFTQQPVAPIVEAEPTTPVDFDQMVAQAERDARLADAPVVPLAPIVEEPPANVPVEWLAPAAPEPFVPAPVVATQPGPVVPAPAAVPEPVATPEAAPVYVPQPTAVPEPAAPVYAPEPVYTAEPVYAPQPTYTPEPVAPPEPQPTFGQERVFHVDVADPTYQQALAQIDPAAHAAATERDLAAVDAIFGGGDAAGGGDVVVSFAGKGGVGKTSIALLIAEAAGAAGKRVAVVDMNRGQGDIRSYLRIDDPNLPTIYNAAVTGQVQDAVISPDQLNASRHPSLPRLHFAVVMAPPAALADPAVVTPAVYSNVIALLRQRVDLVVIDTQIVEAHDTSGLIDRVVVPLLTNGGWGFGVTDMSKPGLENLLRRTTDFVTRGVPKHRLLLAVNKAPSFNNQDKAAIERTFGAYATLLGAVGDNSAFADSLNSGVVDVDNRAVRPVIEAALLAVTDDPAFVPPARGRRGWRR